MPKSISDAEIELLIGQLNYVVGVTDTMLQDGGEYREIQRVTCHNTLARVGDVVLNLRNELNEANAEINNLNLELSKRKSECQS